MIEQSAVYREVEMIHWKRSLALLIVVAAVMASIGGWLGSVVPFAIHW